MALLNPRFSGFGISLYMMNTIHTVWTEHMLGNERTYTENVSTIHTMSSRLVFRMSLVEDEGLESAIWYSIGVLWNIDWDAKSPNDLFANYAWRDSLI